MNLLATAIGLDTQEVAQADEILRTIKQATVEGNPLTQEETSSLFRQLNSATQIYAGAMHFWQTKRQLIYLAGSIGICVGLFRLYRAVFLP